MRKIVWLACCLFGTLGTIVGVPLSRTSAPDRVGVTAISAATASAQE